MSDDVFNVVIGGAIGFAGVVLSQIFAWIFLTIQQKHDAKERSREREYDVKKDLYILVTEEYSRFLINLSDITNKEFKPTLITEVTTPFSTAIAKAQLVASDTTARALDAMMVEVQKMLHGTGQKLLDVWPVQFEIDNNIKLYEKYSAQSDEILRDMGRINLNPNEHMEMQINFLSEKFEQNRKTTEPLLTRRTELNAILAEKKFEYSRHIGDHIISLEKVSTPAFKAIREELGLPWSEEFLASRKETLNVVKKSLDIFLHDTKQKIESDNKTEE